MQNSRPSYNLPSENETSFTSAFPSFIGLPLSAHRTFSFDKSCAFIDWKISEQYYDERKYDLAKSTNSSSELMAKVGHKWTIGGGRHFDILCYCPWCGAKLPEALDPDYTICAEYGQDYVRYSFEPEYKEIPPEVKREFETDEGRKKRNIGPDENGL